MSWPLNVKKNSKFGTDNSSCGSDALDCLDGSCVLDSARCDGIKDCQRTEVDEDNCSEISLIKLVQV